MATSLATMTNTAPRISAGPPHSFATGYASSVDDRCDPGRRFAGSRSRIRPAEPSEQIHAWKITARILWRANRSFRRAISANAVFYIQSGKVKLTVVSNSGKEAVIAHLAAGSFFGEASTGR